ncbi:hypothetical protein DXG01_008617, partial [Tephrocybe rancida]
MPATKRTNTDEPDHLEGSLRVPKSVLDVCEAGFTAADSCRKKASTQFFDDTALMALLCRHDVVLFIANMRSAGKKQHYVLVLMETLFQHLPLPYRVGLLYDIGCQTERSCVKWGFLDRYIERLTFGISVFHAFGHQWVCQIIYHPRKRMGFGLSDGEGCERFWHSISRLIAYLRVCGYHQRLYTLDRQVDHAQSEILENLGQSWNAGKDAVKELIQLHETRDGLKKWQRDYDTLIEAENTPADKYIEVKTELESVCLRLRELTAKIWDKQFALGVADRMRLEKLLNDPFLAARMNALALKQHLHDRLRSRKFELDRLERSFRKQVNGKALRGAICPKQLELKGIFDLDVDDTIWEDIGLEEGMLAAPPPWLADEDMCAGIKALLERDCCIEEEVRLRYECRSMHVWLSEEWRIVNLALGTDDQSLVYHLRLWRSSLLRLCSQWQLSVHSLDFGDITSLPDWGPSMEDILNFHNTQKTALVKEVQITNMGGNSTEYDIELEREEQDEESEYSDSEHGEVDMILIDTIDAVHLADATWAETMDNDQY